MVALFCQLLVSIPEVLTMVDIIFIVAICIVIISIGFINKISKGGN